ncbi:MAG: T9SS type A sorting domain-containing protein [Bacteroidetes bacterium]|nr:T9SS type A sorting domain-containing protein [Bacteroidota bacterium]MBL6943433.1 T9SS type A sorting domain-containing protein [Bacteroidales bacterium]
MKKLLLFAIVLGFVSIGVAQVKQYSPKAWYNTVKETKMAKISDVETTYMSEINPVVSNSRSQDIVIGDTKYDLQSNSTMANRIYTFDDGTIAATWTRGMESPPACPDRGTGYNYFDGTSWGDPPTERIEAQRTGWPNIAAYGANGEIVCSHTFGVDGLIFSWRENKGEGDWNYFSLLGPAGHQDMSWPRMITSGENNEIIHVICVTLGTGNGGTIYEGLDGALLYSRSNDGGVTWDPENEILDGVSSDFTNAWGGDDYAWAQPAGETIAFIAFGGMRDGIVMKSTDNGDNWERIPFYESIAPFYTMGDVIPNFGGGDGYNAAVIDDEGIVHVAFGRQIRNADEAGSYYYPYSDGLVYWNEYMAALDTTMIQSFIIPEDWTTTNLYQNGNLAAWTQPNGNDTIVGVAAYYASLTSMPQLVAHRDAFGQKIIQVFYSALSVGYFHAGNQTNYRHIWGRFTEGDGMFSEFVDYTGDVYHLFSECVYPSVAQTMPDDTYHILYQTDLIPGNSLQPTGAPSHDPVINNMVYLPISPTSVNINEATENFFTVSQNYPNPFTGSANIEITLNKPADLSLEVYNLTGQKVHSINRGYSAGTQNIVIDAVNLRAGIYFYTVVAGEKTITKKMIIE